MMCVECGHEFEHSERDGEALLTEVVDHYVEKHGLLE